MSAAFLEGAIAGYGIAIPVGAIAVLIVDTALRRGFLPGFIAGAGAATADLLYAGLAAVAGGILASLLAPHAFFIRLLSSIVLIGLGGVGIIRSLREIVQTGRSESEEELVKLFVQFLGLTLINPLTVVYFSALIVGGAVGEGSSLIERVAFVLGAGIASFSWQSVLAVLGAFVRKGFPLGVQRGLSVIGNLVVIGLGVRILILLS
ncbi:MAG: LysE family transporter [Anaerolineales bacterium]|nr:LysE family transporter [Anaerolineales bacterium]